jgi:hypothetical protein
LLCIRAEERGRRRFRDAVAPVGQLERAGPEHGGGDQRGSDRRGDSLQTMPRRNTPVALMEVQVALGRGSELFQADEGLLGGRVGRDRRGVVLGDVRRGQDAQHGAAWRPGRGDRVGVPESAWFVGVVVVVAHRGVVASRLRLRSAYQGRSRRAAGGRLS